MDALHKMAGAHRSQDRIAIFAGLGPPGAAAVKTAVKPVTKKVTKEAPQIVNKTEEKIPVKKDLTEKK